MPTASIDFTLASFAMMVLVMGAIFGVNIVVSPYIEGNHYDPDRYQQIGKFMLLSRGEPSNWGGGGIPTNLGFAGEGDPYSIDIDKVTRLNTLNAQALNYSSAWQALGIDDVSFRIQVETLFDITLSPISSQAQGDDTVYNFSASTRRDGYPLQCQVSYYVAVRNSTYAYSGSTDSSGLESIQFTLPNSRNGTAILIGIAKTGESIFSYDVLPFAHNSSAPDQPGTFATLSPLNHSLGADVTAGATAWNAAVFSYSYSFNLSADGSGYDIPGVLDGSPMVLTLTGVNGSDYWGESVAYPQLPLEMGADMDDDYVVSDIHLVSYMVDINGGLYRFVIKFRSPAEYE